MHTNTATMFVHAHEVILESRAAAARLEIEQLEERCKMMQRIAQQYQEERQEVYCHLSKMGLQLNPDNTISTKDQS